MKSLCIQSTNDASVLSKASMARLGYFKDIYMEDLAGCGRNAKNVRRAPLINRGYYVRAAALNQALCGFIHHYHNCESWREKTLQIISFGAGFDSSFFRLHDANLLKNVKFIEIDYYDVAVRKSTLIVNSSRLNACLDCNAAVKVNTIGIILIDTPSYQLIGLDLCHLNLLESSLNACKVNYALPTLLFSECAITYMSKKSATNLFQFLRESFTEASLLVYEQIKPFDTFGRVMCEHFRKLGSPLRNIKSFPTKDAQCTRFLDMGWKTCEILDMNDFYYNVLDAGERQRIEALEIFDEHEEWFMKCAHYTILLASNGKEPLKLKSMLLCDELQPFQSGSGSFDDCSDVLHTELQIQEISQLEKSYPLLCRGHSLFALHLSNNADGVRLLRIGGFGQHAFARGHVFLNSLSLINPTSGHTEHILPTNAHLFVSTLQCAVVQLSSQFANVHHFLLFGGRLSPLRSSANLLRLSFDFNNALSNGASFEEINTCGKPPCARWRHAMTQFKHLGRHYVMMYGGRSATVACLADAYILDLSTWTWRELPILLDGSSWPGARCSATLSTLPNHCGGGVLLFGGLDDTLRPTAQLWHWSPQTELWSIILPSELCTSQLRPRVGHSAHLTSREPGTVHLWLLGGVGLDSACAKDLTRLFLKCSSNGSWTFNLREYKFQVQREDLWPPMLAGHASVLEQLAYDEACKDRLYIIGGGANCFSFGTHFNDVFYKIDLH